MALATNKLLTRYISRQLRPLRQSLIWPSLCNRDYQADFSSGAYTIQVPTAITDREATTVSRNADWVTATDATLTYESKTLTAQSMMASSIPRLDEMQTPVNLVDRERRIHTRGFSAAIDKYVANTIIGAVPNAQITTLAHASQPYLDSRGTWKAVSSGDNTAAKQEAIMEAVYEFIAGYAVAAQEGGWDMDSASPLAIWCVAPPQVTRAFNRWLAKQDLAEMLNTELVTMGKMSGLPMGAFARIEGLTIRRTPRIPQVAGVPGNSGTPPYWQIVVGTRAGASFAAMPGVRQLFSPQQNQTTKPGWLLRASWDYDCWVTYSQTFEVLRIPAGPIPSSVDDPAPKPRKGKGKPDPAPTVEDFGDHDPEVQAAATLGAEAS